MMIFSKMSAQAMVEIKKDLELYKFQEYFQLYLYKGEDLNSYQVTNDGTPSLSDTSDS